jgi:hypothetical protein
MKPTKLDWEATLMSIPQEKLSIDLLTLKNTIINSKKPSFEEENMKKLDLTDKEQELTISESQSDKFTESEKKN